MLSGDAGAADCEATAEVNATEVAAAREDEAMAAVFSGQEFAVG